MKTSILLLLFNRPDLTQRVFEAVQAAKPSRLFIAADGPRADKQGDPELCEQTRAICRNVDWECEVKTLFRDKNLGCKQAVSSAIDCFFQHEEEGIILEDDCLPEPGFFDYCDWALRTYRTASDVWHVSGMGVNRGDAGTLAFTAMPFIWGWATWRDRWAHYLTEIPDAQESMHQVLRAVWRRRTLVDYWVEKLQAVSEGALDTWDYQWLYTIWKNRGLSVTPPMSFVENIGFGKDATHTTEDFGGRYAALCEREWNPPLVAPRAVRDQSLEWRIYKDVFNLDLGLPGSFARTVQSTPAGRYIWLGLRRRLADVLTFTKHRHS